MEVLKFCVVALCILGAADANTCAANDYHFEYTQCDSNSQRWRVSVPNNNDCSPEGERAPVKGTDCNFECQPGHYLDMGSQECKECLPGTFSMGNTARYEDWSKLPEGFTASTQDISYNFVIYNANCTKHGWTPKGSYIAVSPGSCSAYLRYSGTLTKAGKLTFKYQLPDTMIIFHVSVQNDQCQKEEDSMSNIWPDATVDGKWRDAQVDLNSGFNVITWKVIGLSFDNSEPMPVLIKSVTIEGAAYTSECSKCAAGTYSSKGAAECSYCPPNTYSDAGAAMCTNCEKEKEWSRTGAVKCEKRPSCNETDYYRLQTPCDEKKQTRTIYQWIQPQICQPNNPDSVHLPANGKPEPCRPCNPGMQMVNSTCKYCPKDYYSVGEKCEKCDASTFPDTEYMFENWNNVPKELTESCISFTDEDQCHNETKWLAMGDHIETHFARGESAYVILQIKVAGYRTEGSQSDGESLTVGQFKMVFETKCTDFCQMVLLSNEKGYQDVIVVWEGTTSKQKYEYPITRNRSMEFTIAFQNSAYMLNNDEYKNATGIIYSIEVTNTIGGGAKECQKCPKGANKKGCIPCPDGHFIDEVNTTCVRCPPGTVVYTHNAYGAESCKPCGMGLKPQNGKVCVTDGLYEDSQGNEYDLRNLSASYNYIKGSPLFTSTGTQYFHGFNISLFGSPVVCVNNVTKSNESAVRSQNKVEAMICRTTMVPTSGDSSVVMATQSSSLGDRLVEISSNVTHNDNGSASFISKLYDASGFDRSDIDSHIHFHYNSSTPTRACPNGRKTIISLRCDLDEKGTGTIDLPPKCADGTCDGCTFHFLWRSPIACPTCKKEDYQVVIEECIKGKQTVHYFPPTHCIVRDKATKLEEVKHCTMLLSSLPFPLQLGIPAVVALAAILCVLLCYSWRKNKKLEYKYMKLVEGAEGKEGELPGVDSCALEEGEDEGGDSVLIKDSKGARFFKKLKNKMTKDDDAFDTTLMNERMPLT